MLPTQPEAVIKHGVYESSSLDEGKDSHLAVGWRFLDVNIAHGDNLHTAASLTEYFTLNTHPVDLKARQ